MTVGRMGVGPLLMLWMLLLMMLRLLLRRHAKGGWKATCCITHCDNSTGMYAFNHALLYSHAHSCILAFTLSQGQLPAEKPE